MFRWTSATGLLVGLVASSLLASVAAQDASPVASPAQGAMSLDLPAMVLHPSDLGEPGFGLGQSWFGSVESQAEFAASVSGLPVEEILDPLRAAGYVRRYNLNLEQPRRAGNATPAAVSNLVGTRIITAITEYTSAEGAAAGFDLLDRQAEQGEEYQDIALATPIGEESELTRSSAVTPDTDEPYQELNLTFRLDNLVADVVIQDLYNQEPEAAEAEALAEKLEDRIAEVLASGAPGLSAQVIRPEGTPTVDTYVVLAGRHSPQFNEPDDYFADFSRGEGSAADVYTLEQPLGERPYLLAQLHRFRSEEDAAVWIAEQPTLTLAAPDSRYVDVSEVTGEATIGDESRIFAYSLPLNEATTVHGFAIFSRVGPVVARIQLDSVPEAPLAAVLELAEAQVRCLEAGRCLESIPVPAALMASDATPATSPVAMPAG